MSNKVHIRRLATGVPGLDNLLGGGLPEFSFNLIAGAPGSGKTTLAHQIMFSLTNPDNRSSEAVPDALAEKNYSGEFRVFRAFERLGAEKTGVAGVARNSPNRSANPTPSSSTSSAPT